jgi:hypothetical protein
MTFLTSGAAIGAALSDEISAQAPRSRSAMPLQKDPLLGIWKIFGSVSLYLASGKVDRVHYGWVRLGGYGAAVALGVAGLADLLGVDQEETEKES